MRLLEILPLWFFFGWSAHLSTAPLGRERHRRRANRARPPSPGHLGEACLPACRPPHCVTIACLLLLNVLYIHLTVLYCSGGVVFKENYRKKQSLCYARCPNPRAEERRPPRQCSSKKGKFIADSSQGSYRIQHSGAGSESPEPNLLHKFIG